MTATKIPFVSCRLRQVRRQPDGGVATVAWRRLRLTGERAVVGRVIDLGMAGLWEVRQVNVAKRGAASTEPM